MPQNPDWFPSRLDQRPAWQTTFAAQATATGTTHNLIAANVTQAGLDRNITVILVNYDDALRGYVQAWTQFRDFVLDGDPNAAFPTPPTEPTLTIPEEAFKPGIQPRMRGFANTIKGSPNYSQQVGEDYGIVAPEPGEAATPEIRRATPMAAHEVGLSLFKGGYDAVAVDMRRLGGPWTEIGVSLTKTFVDETDPVTPGEPEQREYRLQGQEGNTRTGEMSPTVSAVAVE